MSLPAVVGILLACAACGSKHAVRDTASTTRSPAPAVAISTAGATTTAAAAASGCKVARPALTKLVTAGLAFAGPGKLVRARVIGRPGAYYVAARIIPPGKRTPVGTGVWAASSLSPTDGFVSVNKTAGSYSDWRRADLPLNAAARRWVARATRCVA